MTVKKVKVWYNRDGLPNARPHWIEEFKGETLKIKNGGFIEMDFIEACEFKGTMPSIKLTADGGIDPHDEKRITVEYPPPDADAGSHICQSCGDEFPNATDLLRHIEKNHLSQIAKDTPTEVTPRRGRPPKERAL